MYYPGSDSSNQNIKFFNSMDNQNILFLYFQDDKTRKSTSNTYQKESGSPYVIPYNYSFLKSIPPAKATVKQGIGDFDALIAEAVNRYKALNHAQDYDASLAASFLAALKGLSQKFDIHPYIIFTHSGAKSELDFNGKHFVFDYDYEDPDFIGILCDDNGELDTKVCPIDGLESAFEAF
ncbi:MAG: hypothetical protein LBK44_02445 [Spirochaetales bacterium]|jgi:hypothetical protein|nr:hypothetical protein [Spirochaetales bacterium]